MNKYPNTKLRILALDCEVTKIPHHQPWDSKAYLCSWCLEESIFNTDKSVSNPNTSGVSKVYFFNPSQESHEAMLKEIQEKIDKAQLLVFHNAKFDLSWLIKCGIKFQHKPVWCTMIGEYVLYGQNPNIKLSLNACASRRNMGSKVDAMADFWNNGYETDQIPLDLHEKYVKQDVHLTKQIFEAQYYQLKRAKSYKIAWLTMQISKFLAETEFSGLYFNVRKAKDFVVKYQQEVEQLQQQMFDLVGFEFSTRSATQLEAVMYGGTIKKEVQELVAKQRKNGTYRVYTRKGTMLISVGLDFIPHEYTMSAKTGKYSTGKKARDLVKPTNETQKKFLELLSKITANQKFISTLSSAKEHTSELIDNTEEKGLISKVDSCGRLHPQFNQVVTRTGRLSSSNPNGQNFPRGNTSPIKTLIESTEGFIINADLSQIEWRNAACLSRDKLMMDELWQGFDVHSDRARRSFVGEGVCESSKEFKQARQNSKIFNFRMIYGGTAKAFFYDGAMPDFPLKKYEEIVQDFYKKYSTLREWQVNNFKLLNKQKYLRNPTGRILYFNYNSDPDQGAVGYSQQQVCNYPVQSFSTDCMLIAMYYINKRLHEGNFKCKKLLQVHDSIVLDCPPDEIFAVSQICVEEMRRIPERIRTYFGFDMGIPISCEVAVGPNYGSLPIEFKPEQITRETFFNISVVGLLTKWIKNLSLK